MNTLSQKQRDCLEKAEGIAITTNPSADWKGFEAQAWERLKDKATDNLKEFVIDTIRPPVYCGYDDDYGLSTKIIERLYDEPNLTLKENTEISCKDRTSGVSLPKVKTGSGHWKPFYQTSKY